MYTIFVKQTNNYKNYKRVAVAEYRNFHTLILGKCNGTLFNNLIN